MKFVLTALLCFAFLLGETLALDVDNYTAYIDELMLDEKFLDEYAKWSFELFSQPDYLYGKPRNDFPCPIVKDAIVPTSVHSLRPTDVTCVGAIGDSLTAGLGAHAITPVGLFFENRGVSWSIGGDQTYSKVLSLPNALRKYDHKVGGFSTKSSIIFLNGQDAKNNHLNVAKSGARSPDMPAQAELLMSRLKGEGQCDWDNDWKVITFFVGGNDLCSFCEDPNVTKHTPEQFLGYVRDTLDKLYNAPLPRTFVNMVLVLDARNVKLLNSGGFVCRTLHRRTCPCAAFPTEEQAALLDAYVPQYHELVLALVNSSRYDGRDDFTVVVQPFLAKTQLPYKDDHTIDFSYFAPDCFHFSGKGHAQAALSLWNNMLEPVGAKQWSWHIGENFTCPTEKYPYIFTNKNSPEAVEDYRRAAEAQTTESTTPVISSSSSIETTGSSTEKHKHRKHHKSNFDEMTKLQLAAMAIFFFLIIVLLIAAITRRQQIRVFIHGTGRRHLNGFVNPQYPDDGNDEEVWNRSNTKPDYSINSDISKTHGTRISFE